MKKTTVEILKPFAIGDQSYHPADMPFPDGKTPPRYVELEDGVAKWAIANNTAKPVSHKTVTNNNAHDEALKKAEAKRERDRKKAEREAQKASDESAETETAPAGEPAGEETTKEESE